jgi:hypothetical protein
LEYLLIILLLRVVVVQVALVVEQVDFVQLLLQLVAVAH